MENKVTPPWMKGLILSLVLIVCNLVIYFTGQSQNRALGMVGLLILALGLIFACTSFAKDMHGNVTFGNVFAHGFKTTAATTVIMIIYTVIALKLLFPEMIDQGMQKAREGMEQRGNLTEEQINQGLEFTKKFFMPIVIGTILLMYAVVGAISSLIGAAVAKKNPDYTPLQ